jgi:hypothetical protein
MSESELSAFFESLIRKRELVPHVVIPEGDNEMYVDLTDIKDIELLLDIVKKKPFFDLYEHLFSEYDSIVDRYVNEVIMVFHK